MTKPLESFIFIKVRPTKMYIIVVFRIDFCPEKFIWTRRKSYGKPAWNFWPEACNVLLKISKKVWIFLLKFLPPNCSSGHLESAFDDGSRKNLLDYRSVHLGKKMLSHLLLIK